jgi:outer membrane protein assembly factor BamB
MSQEENSNPDEEISGRTREDPNALSSVLGLVRWCLAGIVCLILLSVIGMYAFRNRWETLGNLTPYFDLESPETKFSRLETNRAEQEGAESLAATQRFDSSWPEYRGSQRDGYSKETNLLDKWPDDGPPELYRQPVGLGFAGFVIQDGRAYTIEQRREHEAVTCYEFRTGHELWAHEYKAYFKEQLGGDGPRATPTLSGEFLYSLGAEGHLVCLSADTGEHVWTVNILSDLNEKNLEWAMAGSPLVVEDIVYVTNSGVSGASFLGFDKLTGELKFKTLVGQQAYVSLMDVELLGKRQILNISAFHLNSFEPGTGKVLWSFPWAPEYHNNCSQPLIINNGKIFISSGYGKGCALVQVTKHDSDSQNVVFGATEIWSNINMKNKFNSSILHEDHVYGLDDGILVCLDIETGKRKWKKGRYGYGQLIYADGNLIVLGERGQLALVEASPDGWNEFSKFQALNAKTWNVPALAGGLLLIRNSDEMVCYDLKSTP